MSLLSYPFWSGDLSEIRSIETLRRHAGYADMHGFEDVASEYRAEIARREACASVEIIEFESLPA